MASFPNFKKKVSDFLSEEDGRIAKQNAFVLGAALLGSSLTLKKVYAATTHGNTVSDTSFGTTAFTFTHTNHGSHGTHSTHSTHSSHGSHSSHGTHGSHGSHGSHGTHASHGSL